MQKMAAIGIERNKIITRDLLVAPLKMLCQGALLRNHELEIGKKVLEIKTKLTSY